MMSSQVVPQGYNQTKVGVIPVEWDVVKLGDVVNMKGGFAFSSKVFEDKVTKYQVVKMSNIYKNRLLLNRSPSYINSISEKEKEYLLENKDSLITLTGTMGKRDYGYSIQIKKEINLLVNQRLARIREIKEKSDGLFIGFLLKTDRFLFQFFESSKGGTGNQANVSIKDLNSFLVPLAPLKEQQKIAKILTTWDNAISKQEALIKAKEELKKGLMQRLLSGEVRFGGGALAPQKKSKNIDGAKAPSPEWEEVQLKNIAKITMGQSPSSNSYNEDNIGIPLIQGNADCKNRKTLPRMYTTEKTKECFIGDIIMTVRAPVGAISKSLHNACIGRGVCSIKSKEDNEFLYHFFVNHEKRWDKYSQGSTFTAVNSNDIKNLKIKLPPLKEQQKIAQVLTLADKEIDLLKTELEALKEQKRGLMQGLLSGVVRVRV